MVCRWRLKVKHNWRRGIEHKKVAVKEFAVALEKEAIIVSKELSILT